jgi:hypothetical protein
MASTGTPAERARDDGIDVITATTDMSELARTATDGTAGGLLILAADRSRHVLIGAAAVGPGADEWISEASVAIRASIPLTTLADVVHPLPNLRPGLRGSATQTRRPARVNFPLTLAGGRSIIRVPGGTPPAPDRIVACPGSGRQVVNRRTGRVEQGPVAESNPPQGVLMSAGGCRGWTGMRPGR